MARFLPRVPPQSSSDGELEVVTHNADLWDYHVTAVAAAAVKGPSQSGPSVSHSGQFERPMGYQRPPHKANTEDH